MDGLLIYGIESQQVQTVLAKDRNSFNSNYTVILRGMVVLKKFIKDTNGDAIIEATILFPIMIMIFAALVLLSMYLPTKAVLQRATQYAATALATERSDTWLFYNENNMSYVWKKDNLENVYFSFINISDDATDRAETIVKKVEEGGISVTSGDLTVEYGIVNYVIYKEIVVTATRTIPVAVDLSFIGFPKEIPITVTSTAVVQNGDEFVRNLDIAVDFVKYIDEKYNIKEAFESVSKLGEKFESFLGWN